MMTMMMMMMMMMKMIMRNKNFGAESKSLDANFEFYVSLSCHTRYFSFGLLNFRTDQCGLSNFFLYSVSHDRFAVNAL